MNQLTQILYLLSNSLLIPVMLLLIVSLVRVLIQSGRTIQEYLSRRQQVRSRRAFEHAVHGNEPSWPAPSGMDHFPRTLRELMVAGEDLPRVAYVLSQAELHWQSSIDRLKGLVKLGPGLGLMGTLIPLGPALVGLAVGDIQTMSNNLVIAFSTTVLGLFVGMLASYLVSVKKHWYQADAALLNYVAERLSMTSPSHSATSHSVTSHSAKRKGRSADQAGEPEQDASPLDPSPAGAAREESHV